MSRTGKKISETTHDRHTSTGCQWRRWIRSGSIGATVAGIAVVGALTLTSHQESSAATYVGAGRLLAAQVTASPSSTKPGEMDPNMPGMDHSSPTPTRSAEMDPNMPGMDDGGTHQNAAAAETAARRPLAPVLGTFGAGTGAVMLGAAVMRRKDRAADAAKKATRSARRSGE